MGSNYRIVGKNGETLYETNYRNLDPKNWDEFVASGESCQRACASIIKVEVGIPAVYEQLAEEATELAQAALKYARILRGENPCGTSEEEAWANLVEELTDLKVVADVLDLEREVDMDRYDEKVHRWVKRIGETKETNVEWE